MAIKLGRGVTIGTGLDEGYFSEHWSSYRNDRPNKPFVFVILEENPVKWEECGGARGNSSDFLVREIEWISQEYSGHQFRAAMETFRRNYATDPLLMWDTENHCWSDRDVTVR